jgi:hypothetical protein
MKKLAMLLALVVIAGGAIAADNAEVGVGVGVIIPSGDENPCPPSELLCNHDGSFENGYAWQYGGVVEPYYGAFAEGYAGTGSVCGMQFWFTALSGQYLGQTFDAYVWDSDGLSPNNVLSVTVGLGISPPAIWPSISSHDIDNTDTDVAGDFFVGYWGNWPGGYSGWFIAADLDGFGGLPRTNIAPGIGYPTGWQDPSIVWGPTQAMGICAYLGPECGTPVEETTWGAIQALY